MRKNGLIAASCALALISMNAESQSHQHGHGEVVIAQDGKIWEVQMTLPSADVFGFEHEPENKKEHAKFDAQVERLKQSASVVQLPAGCSVKAYDVEAPFSDHHEGHHEDHHADQHDDYGNDDYSEDEHHEHDEHEAHSDVEVSIEMTCKQAPSEIVFTVFSLSDSISELLVQWATDKGQGSRELTPTNPRLVF